MVTVPGVAVNDERAVGTLSVLPSAEAVAVAEAVTVVASHARRAVGVVNAVDGLQVVSLVSGEERCGNFLPTVEGCRGPLSLPPSSRARIDAEAIADADCSCGW